MDKKIELLFMTEKMAGHGEDAPPLLLQKDASFAVGVFDGMGGAGAATCDSVYGEGFTKAYVASRIVKDAVQSFLAENLCLINITADDLKKTISVRLQEEQKMFPPKSKTMLRSKLVRDYPTTMALIALHDKDNSWQVDSFWAGDSHCYLWNKDGFFQISKDDLGDDNDPMENLHNDSPISNCICADRDFYLNHKSLAFPKEPVVILCATDGCFGYYQSPMHFEDMLKKCLSNSKDEKDWEEKIKHNIQKVTGDDASLSLMGIGFHSFGSFKNILTNRSVPSIKKIKELEKEVRGLRERLERKSNEYEEVIRIGWEGYKHNYMKYINDEEYANGNNANA